MNFSHELGLEIDKYIQSNKISNYDLEIKCFEEPEYSILLNKTRLIFMYNTEDEVDGNWFIYHTYDGFKKTTIVSMICKGKEIVVSGRFDRTFSWFEGLEHITINNLRIKNGTNLDELFDGCTNLKSIDMSNWIIEDKVKSMNSLFWGCSELESVRFPNCRLSILNSFNSVFHGCKALKEVDLSNLHMDNVETMTETFYGCENIEKIIFPNNKLKLYDITHLFYRCNKELFNTLDLGNIEYYTDTCIRNINDGIVSRDSNWMKYNGVIYSIDNKEYDLRDNKLNLVGFNSIEENFYEDMYYISLQLKKLNTVENIDIHIITDISEFEKQSNNNRLRKISKIEYCEKLNTSCYFTVRNNSQVKVFKYIKEEDLIKLKNIDRLFSTIYIVGDLRFYGVKKNQFKGLLGISGTKWSGLIYK